ncbi:hypothetical protein Plhal703r1_c11g0059011 [Plasmopara halstedii]
MLYNVLSKVSIFIIVFAMELQQSLRSHNERVQMATTGSSPTIQYWCFYESPARDHKRHIK